MTEKDGGAAFPTKGGLVFYFPENVKEQLQEVEKRVTSEHLGMTLRDYYAGQALMGLASRLSDQQVKDLADGVKGGAIEAKAASALADAMLQARSLKRDSSE